MNKTIYGELGFVGYAEMTVEQEYKAGTLPLCELCGGKPESLLFDGKSGCYVNDDELSDKIAKWIMEHGGKNADSIV